jgi:hypothetical protein
MFPLFQPPPQSLFAAAAAMDESELDSADSLWQLSPQNEEERRRSRRRREGSTSTPEKDNEELRRVLRSKCHQVKAKNTHRCTSARRTYNSYY